MKPMPKWATSAAVLFTGLVLFLSACSGESNRPEDPLQPAASSENKYDQYQIVTLLPRDAIQAIDDPEFLDVDDADESYEPQEMILGVELNGEARAYSVPFLSSHEIVNDFVGGVPIAVTW
jgi:hypothetical protein